MLENQHFYDGPEGNRTPVRKPIPSTIIVCYLSFPPSSGSRHPDDFSSFIIRPPGQSLPGVVSYIVDARFSACRCAKADSCTRQRLLNYLQRLYLILPFNPSHGDSFTSFIAPVETSTSPYWHSLGVKSFYHLLEAASRRICSLPYFDNLPTCLYTIQANAAIHVDNLLCLPIFDIGKCS